MDKQTYDRLVREARIHYAEMDNAILSHKVTMISRGKPRSMPKWEHEALLVTAADRLWKAHHVQA